MISPGFNSLHILIRDTIFRFQSGIKLKDWELNEKLSEYLSYKEIPVVRRFTVQIAQDPLPPAQVLLMTPPNADLSGATKYPMLVNV